EPGPLDGDRAPQRAAPARVGAGHDHSRALVRSRIERHATPFERRDQLEGEAAARDPEERPHALGDEGLGELGDALAHRVAPKKSTMRPAEKRTTTRTASGL